MILLILSGRLGSREGCKGVREEEEVVVEEEVTVEAAAVVCLVSERPCSRTPTLIELLCFLFSRGANEDASLSDPRGTPERYAPIRCLFEPLLLCVFFGGGGGGGS